MKIKGLDKLNQVVSGIGNKLRPQILEGLKDGVKKIRKEYHKKGIAFTKENVMKDLTSDKSYLDVLKKSDISLDDLEQIVDEVINAPEPIHVEKIGRNEPCPCGSGKKYKKCCGN